jgi:CBS domain-containing protein
MELAEDVRAAGNAPGQEMVTVANTRASDIMTRDVITVTPEMSLDELHEAISRNGIHGVPVVDHSGRLVGMVGVDDLAGKFGTVVLHIMERHPVTAPEDAPVGEIASLMLTRRISRVPILRDGRLVGIVCASDIIRAFVDLEKERAGGRIPVEHAKA